MPYAERTDISPEKSRAEIEKLLKKYGATSFVFGWSDGGGRETILFEVKGRRIRMEVPLPQIADFRYTPERGLARSTQSQREAHEQAVRQRWRAFALIIKAKLEAVESGITTIDDEFLAHVIIPNGQTLREWVQPQLDAAYQSGAMPPLLPGRKD